MSTHAFLSASGAPAWTRCEIKPWREKDLPDETSEAAKEGTKAHELLELCIKNKQQPWYFDGYSKEMQDDVWKTLSFIESFRDAECFSEVALDISSITGEEGAKGTADVVLVFHTALTIIDLKYGFGRVSAVGNEQLLIYAAAALEEFDLVGDISTISMVISQPRLNVVDEWVITVDELLERVSKIKEIASRILVGKGGDNYLHATPGDKQCQFCKVRGNCPEYRGFALATVTDDFVDIDKEEQFLDKVKNAELRLPASDDKHLATCMDAVGMIEQWCEAVRKETFKRLINGNFTDPRYKLVEGRGSTRFRDAALVAKQFEIEDMFILKLKSPAQLRQEWKGQAHMLHRLEEHIVRVKGKPTVVRQEDKRPALDTTLEFDMIGDEEFIESLIGLTHEDNPE